MQIPSLHHLPFWLHILFETPAALNFGLRPRQQLQLPPVKQTPQASSAAAEAVIRQYATLLFVSDLIALIFALRPVDLVSKNVAAALSVYHLAPAARAIGRLRRGEEATGGGMGGPIVHLLVHSLCFAGLSSLYFIQTEVI